MRTRRVVPVALVCLGLASAIPTRADVLVGLAVPQRIAPGGGQFGFEGSITNSGPGEVFITSHQIEFTTGFDNVNQDFIPSFIDLPNGASFDGVVFTDTPTNPPPGFVPQTHQHTLFSVNMGGPDDQFTGDIRLFGGPTSTSDSLIGVFPFASAPAGVPEPGSLAMLTGAAVTGLLFLRRRLRR